MAIRTIATYEALVWDSLVQMLGLNPALPATQMAVRSTWTQPGQPGFTITEDIVFYRVVTGGDTYDQKVYPVQGTNTQAVEYTRVITLAITAYGPKAADNLEQIRTSFLAGYGTLNLQKEKIFPLINPGSVVRTPEYFEGQWWERADFSIVMYAKESTTVAIPEIESAKITVIAEDEERRIINA